MFLLNRFIIALIMKFSLPKSILILNLILLGSGWNTERKMMKNSGKNGESTVYVMVGEARQVIQEMALVVVKNAFGI